MNGRLVCRLSVSLLSIPQGGRLPSGEKKGAFLLKSTKQWKKWIQQSANWQQLGNIILTTPEIVQKAKWTGKYVSLNDEGNVVSFITGQEAPNYNIITYVYELSNNKLIVKNLVRPEDLYAWKFAKRGFFKFKENIPAINKFINEPNLIWK